MIKWCSKPLFKYPIQKKIVQTLPIVPYWKGVWASRIDAILNTEDGKAYFFKGDKFVAFDVKKDAVDEGYPKNVKQKWTNLPFTRIDAAIYWKKEAVYFFKDNKYVKCNPITNLMEPGYPKLIIGNWPGMTFATIDAALKYGDFIYFIKNVEYIKYSIKEDKAVGVPKPIALMWADM